MVTFKIAPSYKNWNKSPSSGKLVFGLEAGDGVMEKQQGDRASVTDPLREQQNQCQA